MLAFLFAHAALPLFATPLILSVSLAPPTILEAAPVPEAIGSPARPPQPPPMCPRPRPYHGFCAQVVVWAKHPGAGICCLYPTPCNAPPGWRQFYSREACQSTPRR
jgi:hypothetical protein